MKFSPKQAKKILYNALRQGLTPHKLAMTCALGVVVGIFPVFGTTTILCFAVAIAFRLNIPVCAYKQGNPEHKFFYQSEWFIFARELSKPQHKHKKMAEKTYDLIVIGSGPGGYVAAIRASQLGMKVGVVEKAELGGICLNWGCIPTKALLKSANVFEYISHAKDYGIEVKDFKSDLKSMVKRSRDVAASNSKGVQFLFKKNKIELIEGTAKIKKGGKVEVTGKDGEKTDYEAKHTIIATGGRSRELPSMRPGRSLRSSMASGTRRSRSAASRSSSRGWALPAKMNCTGRCLS